MAYLCGFLSIYLQYGDFAAARRNAQLQAVIARKQRAKRIAARGRA